jgi:hypothetical protein
MFSIKFIADIENSRRGVARGIISIGKYQEEFESELGFWNCVDYMKHWDSSIRRLTEGAEKSVLVTSITEPLQSNFLFWWPMYRIGEFVYVQNHVLLLKELTKPFEISRLIDFVPERETTNESGESISEWSLKVSELEEFINFSG